MRTTKGETKTAQARRLVGSIVFPVVSSISDLNYRLTGLRSFIVLHTLDDVPQELKNLDSPAWKDSALLRDTFKKPSSRTRQRPQKSETTFPACLLSGAKTLLALTHEQHTHHKSQFGRFFKRPTKSASPIALRTSAAGAAVAQERGMATRAVSIFDSVGMKQAQSRRVALELVNDAKSL